MVAFNCYCFAQFENVRISKITSRSPQEVTITINPVNLNIMAAGANINYSYISTDAGKSWTEKSLKSTLGVWGDPAEIFDNKNNLYYAHLSRPIEGHWIDRIVVQKSTDYGETWNDGAGIGYNFPEDRPRPKFQDKAWLAADLTDSDYQNNVYVSWTEFDR